MSRPLARTTLPEGIPVDVVPLETIDFAHLVAKEPAEIAKLIKASETLGFFYLNLQSEASQQILAATQGVYRVIEEYFCQPQELKLKDYKASQAHGFKPAFENGSTNRCETFQVARDDMVKKVPVLPGIVQDHAELFEYFISRSHWITQTLLSCLSDALKLDNVVRSHRDGEPSNTGLVLVYDPPCTELADDGRHTDGGSLTLFFHEQWGLQLELPETKDWAFVEPRAGHVVVNIGDWLQFQSGNKLKSGMHRVIKLDGGLKKMSFAILYFLRPENAIKKSEDKE